MDLFQSYNIEDLVRITIALVVLFSGLISILFVIWGGFLLIVSGGNEEKIKPAVNHVRHAIIGVVFIFAVIFIAPKIFDIIGLEGSKYASPGVVFATIQELAGSIFSGEANDGLLEPDNNSNTIGDDFSDL